MLEYSLSAVDFDPFAGDAIEKVVPVTEPQQEIWISCVLGGEEANLAFNESISLEFTGSLVPDVLMKALQLLVDRHEALRAGFSADGMQMVIYKQKKAFIQEADISLMSRQAQTRHLDHFIRKEAATPFDLSKGPLIKFGLFKLAENKVHLHVNAHHIVCDGWSFGILLEDLSALYNSVLSSSTLPPAPDQFSSYAIEEAAFQRTAEYAAIENYWIRKYKDNVPVFEIPTDFPRGKVRSYRCEKNDFILSKSLADAIKSAGARYGSSFVNTLVAAFEVAIYKITKQRDIVLGLPTAGQAATGMFNLIGHCVNFLPLRSHPSGNIKFSDYLKTRKRETADDYENQRFTFGALLKRINIKRDATWTPLTPVCFNIDIGMDRNVHFQDVVYDIVYNPKVSEIFDIFLNITESKDGYIFQWTYNTQLYRGETIKRLMDKISYLLNQLSENPQLEIDQYSLEDNSVIFNNINQLNNTHKVFPDTTFVELFEENVSASPDAVALQFKEQLYSYKQLNEAANRMARYLIENGVKQGSHVGLLLDRDAGIPISLLAVLKCGAVYVPFDPDFPDDRLNFMIADADLSVIITNKSNANRFQLSGTTVFIESVKEKVGLLSPENISVNISCKDGAYILYTSGSTGKPKGVVVSQKNLVNLLLGAKDFLGANASTKLLSVTTVSFDIATLEILLPLVSGGSIVLADSVVVKDGERIVEAIRTQGINLFQATPATYKMMLSSGWEQKLPIKAISGGEALSRQLADELLNRVEVLYNMYGPTETTIYSTGTLINKGQSEISIGTPLANTQIYILDEDGALLPEGAVGEIFIGGAGVSEEYYNRPELTAERFLKNPFDKTGNTRMYKTGDLGKYTADGKILCLGRVDYQVKIRGFRIELEEIENEIINIPEIKDVKVAVREDHLGELKLCAFIIPEDFTTAGITKAKVLEWRNLLKRKLPQYMIPAEWVAIETFPVTPNKKVDRKALLDFGKLKLKQTGAPVSVEVIDLLTRIWQEELEIEDITPSDDFFELGGHSMSAIRVMSRIKTETEVKLPISALFEHPTIQGLSQLIAVGKNTNQNRVVVPIKEGGAKTPIFLIHAGGLNILLYKSLGHFFEEDQPLYGLQGLGLDGDTSHLSTIESIASRYLVEVLEQEPDGPYIILGYSYGGVIAFEMARQLLRMDKKVKMLGVLDTNVSGRNDASGEIPRFYDKIKRQFRKAIYIGGAFLKYPEDVLNYQKLVFNRKFNKNFEEKQEDQIYDYEPHIVQAYEDAYHRYRMQPLDIEIHLFRADKRVYFVDDSEYLGWKKYALKGVKVHRVPGDHKTFLLPPNSKMVARLIEDNLKKIN